MIHLEASVEFQEVFTADYDGLYHFAPVPDGFHVLLQFRVKRGAVYESVSLLQPVVMAAGDSLEHSDSACDLYGYRHQDEL